MATQGHASAEHAAAEAEREEEDAPLAAVAAFALAAMGEEAAAEALTAAAADPPTPPRGASASLPKPSADSSTATQAGSTRPATPLSASTTQHAMQAASTVRQLARAALGAGDEARAASLEAKAHALAEAALEHHNDAKQASRYAEAAALMYRAAALERRRHSKGTATTPQPQKQQALAAEPAGNEAPAADLPTWLVEAENHLNASASAKCLAATASSDTVRDGPPQLTPLLFDTAGQEQLCSRYGFVLPPSMATEAAPSNAWTPGSPTEASPPGSPRSGHTRDSLPSLPRSSRSVVTRASSVGARVGEQDFGGVAGASAKTRRGADALSPSRSVASAAAPPAPAFQLLRPPVPQRSSTRDPTSYLPNLSQGCSSSADFVAARAVAAAADAATIPGAPSAVLAKGAVVWYENQQRGKRQHATVEAVHYDDQPPYYTVRFTTGETRETTRGHLHGDAGSAVAATSAADVVEAAADAKDKPASGAAGSARVASPMKSPRPAAGLGHAEAIELAAATAAASLGAAGSAAAAARPESLSSLLQRPARAFGRLALMARAISEGGGTASPPSSLTSSPAAAVTRPPPQPSEVAGELSPSEPLFFVYDQNSEKNPHMVCVDEASHESGSQSSSSNDPGGAPIARRWLDPRRSWATPTRRQSCRASLAPAASASMSQMPDVSNSKSPSVELPPSLQSSSQEPTRTPSPEVPSLPNVPSHPVWSAAADFTEETAQAAAARVHAAQTAAAQMASAAAARMTGLFAFSSSGSPSRLKESQSNVSLTRI